MTCLTDLHTHSTASDGTLSPTELVRLAAQHGVRRLALTDHDTLEGLAEAKAAAEQLQIDFVPGVEVSVTWNKGTIHLVGLNIDPSSEPLIQGLKQLRAFRDWRGEEIGRRLERSGIPGAYAGAKALSNGRSIGRAHFARYLLSQGLVKSIPDVFKKYLVKGKPGHVAGDWATLEEAVSWINQAGGVAVIAHPARYRMTRTKLRKLLQAFVDVGGRGLEIVSGSHSRDEAFTMARHARDFDLLASAGSDYHSPENAWSVMGRLDDLPDGCRPVWQNWS